MKINLKCLQCNIGQIIKVADIVDATENQKEWAARAVFEYLKDIDFSKSNPEIMSGTWKIITKGFDNEDPYKDIRIYYNNALMEVYDDIKKLVESSENRFKSGLMMAVTGNLIDFGANHNFSIDLLIEKLHMLESDNCLEIDHSDNLYEKLLNGKSLLYIGDNCGEIVLDKIFIEEIQREFPQIEVYFSVRGEPILNDVTMMDANMVRMSEVANVIESGDGAPGTVLSQTSAEFKKLFDNADVIIAKGQGNYESLSDVKREGLFLTLMAKCPVVSDCVGCTNMKCVCLENL
jgi:uncharacterized protein with ATP-grasp and redox domains